MKKSDRKKQLRGEPFAAITRAAVRNESARNWLTENDVVAAESNSISVQAGEKQTTICLDGAIGKSWWDDSGISSAEFTAAFNEALTYGKPIEIMVNSIGGSVGEGLCIYDTIARHSNQVSCRVTGYALSIASVFPLAAGKIVSPSNAIWMIHEASCDTGGTKRDKLKDAAMLAVHDSTIAGIYAKRTGKTSAYWLAKMEDETWMNGDEAVAEGFADGDEMPQNILNAATTASVPVMAATQTATITAILSVDADKNKTTAAANGGTQTQTQNKHMPENTPTAAAQTTAPDALAQVQAQLATERKARITAEVTRRAENKITNDKLSWWINQAVTDEAGTLAQIDALPAAAVQSPLAPSGVSMGSEVTPVSEIKKLGGAKARYAKMKEDWGTLIANSSALDKRRNGVQNANTYSSSLVTQFLLDGAVTQLQNKLAMLKAFTRDFSTDAYKPLATAQLKYVTGGSTTLTNPTNFESGDSTVSNVAITVNHYAQPFHVSDSELNSGLRMENLVNVNSRALASKIIEVCTTPITAANFTGAPLTSTAANFGFSSLQTLWGQLQKANTKNIVLDGTFMAKLLNNPTYYQQVGDFKTSSAVSAFGWDLIALNSDWTAADAKTVGFACDPQSIGVVGGLPLSPQAASSQVLSVSTETIPDVGLSISTFRWTSLATRTEWLSYELMIGAAKLDGTAGILIQTP